MERRLAAILAADVVGYVMCTVPASLGPCTVTLSRPGGSDMPKNRDCDQRCAEPCEELFQVCGRVTGGRTYWLGLPVPDERVKNMLEAMMAHQLCTRA